MIKHDGHNLRLSNKRLMSTAALVDWLNDLMHETFLPGEIGTRRESYLELNEVISELYYRYCVEPYKTEGVKNVD